MAYLEMTDIAKRYGSVLALDGASLSANRGEVHGLLGPNGSGKSTLNKVLTGVVEADRAQIVIDGRQIVVSGPMDAHKQGVAAVYQQLSLIPELSVEQNIVLGTEPGGWGFVSARRSREAARKVMDRFGSALGSGVTPGTRVDTLSPGQAQIVEICKALVRRPEVLVLDEATASLGQHQTEVLFDIIREECSRGACVIFVSHRLDEVFALCQRATVVRSGRTVATVEISETDENELVRLMVGEDYLRKVSAVRDRTPDENADVTFAVDGLSTGRLSNISFSLRRGEIVGLGGLQGQGQSDLLMSLFGAERRHTGTITIGSRTVEIRTPVHARRAGVALVPGDRGSQGLLGQRPIQENISIVSLVRRARAGFALSRKLETAAARRMVDRLAIKIGSLKDPVSSLSGGNQQKVILAKWLLADPSVVLLDDPTKGVDVGAKAEVYALMRELADAGVSILFNSSEDRELADLADRVLVLYEGRIVQELSAPLSIDTLVAAALRVDAEPDAETEVEL